MYPVGAFGSRLIIVPSTPLLNKYRFFIDNLIHRVKKSLIWDDGPHIKIEITSPGILKKRRFLGLSRAKHTFITSIGIC